MVTSNAVSRGCLAAIVGRRFLRDGLCVYFADIRSLFAFILLMIMFCIGAGYTWHCLDGLFYFFIIQNNGKQIKAN